jgi:hypothetical protein
METVPTVQSVVASRNQRGELQPLLNNAAYVSAVNAELLRLHNAKVAADALAERQEDLISVATIFSTVMGFLNNMLARFPVAAPYIQEAIKQIQLAMGVLEGNVPAPTPAPGPAPASRPASASPFNFGQHSAAPVVAPPVQPTPRARG